MSALGLGYLKIESNKGAMMYWPVVYTPSATGTVLSPDGYMYCIKEIKGVFIGMMKDSRGSVEFVDGNRKTLQSIDLKRNLNGEWNTTNKILQAHGYKVHITRAKSREYIPSTLSAELNQDHRITRPTIQYTHVKIKNESMNELPTYQTIGSSGMDLMVYTDKPIIIPPYKWDIISTGIKIALLNGIEAQIQLRSGLAAKKGVTVLNPPGTIDSD